jgi:hypothetical protein
MDSRNHDYRVSLNWTGNTGAGGSQSAAQWASCRTVLPSSAPRADSW